MAIALKEFYKEAGLTLFLDLKECVVAQCDGFPYKFVLATPESLCGLIQALHMVPVHKE